MKAQAYFASKALSLIYWSTLQRNNFLTWGKSSWKRIEIWMYKDGDIIQKKKIQKITKRKHAKQHRPKEIPVKSSKSNKIHQQALYGPIVLISGEQLLLLQASNGPYQQHCSDIKYIILYSAECLHHNWRVCIYWYLETIFGDISP